jgi:hypothetical protein
LHRRQWADWCKVTRRLRRELKKATLAYSG